MGFSPGSRATASGLSLRWSNGEPFARILDAMRTRELLPGATIAALLTASALLALLVGLGIRGDGPLAIDLGGSAGRRSCAGARIRARALPAWAARRPASLTLPSVTSGGGVAASSSGSAARRRRTAALQGAAGRERAGRAPPGHDARARARPSRDPGAREVDHRPGGHLDAATAVAVKVRGRGSPGAHADRQQDARAHAFERHRRAPLRGAGRPRAWRPRAVPPPRDAEPRSSSAGPCSATPGRRGSRRGRCTRSRRRITGSRLDQDQWASTIVGAASAARRRRPQLDGSWRRYPPRSPEALER